MSEKKSASILYDPKARSLFFQLAVFLAIAVLLYFGVKNLIANYPPFSEDNYSFFGFMGQPSPVRILTTFGTWITQYQDNVSSFWVAFLVGLWNTLIIAFFGIIFATVWGFILGIFRLSPNFILRSFSTIYVETLRNIPLLLQILFWIAITRTFSDTRKVSESIEIIKNVVYYNAEGLRGPYLDWQTGGIWVFFALVFGLIAAYLVGRWAKKRQEATGQQFPAFWVGLALIIILPTVVFLMLGRPVIVELPTEVTTGSKLKQGFFESGVGSVVVPEFIALFLALFTYTASFIAEIVRAGILAVKKGQTEASQALGLHTGVRLRKIILPQALRVIIPPLTSQYLNLTKNSSLAAAIGYPEVVALFAGTVLNQTGRAVEIILMVIATYLFISLAISLLMNWLNNRIKIVER